MIRTQERCGKFQHHLGGLSELSRASYYLHHVYRNRCCLRVKVATAALNQSRGVIDGNGSAAFVVNVTTNRQRCRAERAAQVIDLRAGLNEALSQHADHRDNIGITGNRALDHIREDFGYPFIEGPVAQAGDRRGKKRVAI